MGIMNWLFGECGVLSVPKEVRQGKLYYIGSYDTDIAHYDKKRMRGSIPKWVRDWIYDLDYQEGRHDYRKPDYNPQRGQDTWVKHASRDNPHIAYLHGKHYSYKLQSDDIHKMIYIYKRKN